MRETALRKRLELVVRDHPQAKLARLTGRSRTALTRYMQGARIPLEFATALCAELGVSPAWLVSGAGAMYVADLPAASTELGRDLLELIRTMDAVAGAKVGSFAGKHEARALREISDSLALYGSLRQRLHARTRPVLAELLQQLEDAVSRRQYDRAASIEETATKVERYTDDLELSRRLMRSRAHILHVRQQSGPALEVELKLFQALLGSGAPFADVADAATALSLTLRAEAYSARARRAVRMAMACAEGAEQHSYGFASLLSQEIMACVELGEMQGLTARVEHMMAAARQDQHTFAGLGKLFYYVHAGLLAPTEVVGAPHAGFPAAAMVLGIAVWTENADLIERALGPVRTLANPQMPLNLAHLEAGERALGVLRGKSGAVDLDSLHARATGNAGRLHALGEVISTTQLLRLAGDSRAGPLMHKAQAWIEDFPQDRSPWPIAVARHLRNVLVGIPANTRSRRDRALRQRAQTLCEQRIARGYGLLRELVQPGA